MVVVVVAHVELQFLSNGMVGVQKLMPHLIGRGRHVIHGVDCAVMEDVPHSMGVAHDLEKSQQYYRSQCKTTSFTSNTQA